MVEGVAAEEVAGRRDPTGGGRVRLDPAALCEERRMDVRGIERVEHALLHAGAGRAIRVLRVERQGDPERAYRSTPVMTTPRTKTRWKMKNMTTGSTIVMSVPAWMIPGSRFEWMPLNRASATESVWRSWLAER